MELEDKYFATSLAFGPGGGAILLIVVERFAMAMRRLLLFLFLLVTTTALSDLYGQSCESCEPPPPSQCGQWNSEGCFCMDSSPIIIDLAGRGLRLTSASEGVLFDIRGDGKKVQMAWTSADTQAAFLVLDRNGNGTIDSGKELFGNFTQQSSSEHPNGFQALAEFDKSGNGGNEDGILDASDEVFFSLLLWVDRNHNGISEPSELTSLSASNVASISLRYGQAARRDRYGNRLRYRAKVDFQGESVGGAGVWAYDVFFAIQDVPGITTTNSNHVLGSPSFVDGALTPAAIPLEIVYGFFLRAASCTAPIRNYTNKNAR